MHNPKVNPQTKAAKNPFRIEANKTGITKVVIVNKPTFIKPTLGIMHKTIMVITYTSNDIKYFLLYTCFSSIVPTHPLQ